MAGAQGVVITTDVPVDGRAAVPVYVDESIPMEGGPARAVQVVTSGPMAGGAPMAVRLAPAGTPTVGPALPIYIVSGILDVLAYASKVKSVAAANLIGYWPLAESSGTTIVDESGNGRNGTYTGVDLGQPGIGDGRTSPLFDGANDYGNVYGASFAGAFNGGEGTIAAWARITSAGVWTDTITRRVFLFQADVNNRISFARSSSNGTMDLFYQAGGVNSSRSFATGSTLAWMHFALTWSKSADQAKVYYNGVQQGATLTGLGVWAGALTTTAVNIGTAGQPSLVWSGNIAHFGVWSSPLSAGQIAQIATVP